MSDFGTIQTTLWANDRVFLAIGHTPSESIRLAFEAAEIRTGQRVADFKNVRMVTEPVSYE